MIKYPIPMRKAINRTTPLMYHIIRMTLDPDILPLDPIQDTKDVDGRPHNTNIKMRDLNGGETKKPLKIKIVLKPFIMYNNGQYLDSYLTGIYDIDNIIKHRLKNDYTNVCRIATYVSLYNKKYRNSMTRLICDNYSFKDNLIYLTLHKSNNEPFSKVDYRDINDAIETYNKGPESWIDNNIIIYQGPKLKETGIQFLYKQYQIELGIILLDIIPIMYTENN